MRILILGAGGHAQVIADALLCAHAAGSGLEPIGFLDDNQALTNQSRLGLRILGPFSALPQLPHDACVIGIGDNLTRLRVWRHLKEAGESFARVIHPRAILAPDVTIGEGVVIFAGVIINTGASIGKNVILNTGCTVDHHSTVGDHAHIAPGVHLGGDVTVGEGTLIGIGATVMPQRHIGAWSIVGAGALAWADIPDRTTVVGVPAQPLHA